MLEMFFGFVFLKSTSHRKPSAEILASFDVITRWQISWYHSMIIMTTDGTAVPKPCTFDVLKQQEVSSLEMVKLSHEAWGVKNVNKEEKPKASFGTMSFFIFQWLHPEGRFSVCAFHLFIIKTVLRNEKPYRVRLTLPALPLLTQRLWPNKYNLLCLYFWFMS